MFHGQKTLDAGHGDLQQSSWGRPNPLLALQPLWKKAVHHVTVATYTVATCIPDWCSIPDLELTLVNPALPVACKHLSAFLLCSSPHIHQITPAWVFFCLLLYWMSEVAYGGWQAEMSASAAGSLWKSGWLRATQEFWGGFGWGPDTPMEKSTT